MITYSDFVRIWKEKFVAYSKVGHTLRVFAGEIREI
jgi:hypothetical protein